MVERVFIAGMYKSGTSWLLSALAAHPDILGVREIDILKAVGNGQQDNYKLKSTNERINHVFGGTAWCGIQVDLHAPGEIRRFMSAGELQQAGEAQSLSELEPDVAIKVLARLLGEKRIRRAGEKAVIASHEEGFPSVRFGELGTADRNRPVSCIHLSPDNLQQLFVSVRDANDPFTAARAFMSVVEKSVRSEEIIVYKAADMMARMKPLNALQKNVRKIIVVRDGRDAAISALHYRELMHEQRMPWNKNRAGVHNLKNLSRSKWVTMYLGLFKRLGNRAKADYFNSLRHWARRVRILMESETDTDLYVLRYEDLTQDFSTTMGDLLAWLGLPNSSQAVEKIAEATSFERMSGRSRGEAAKEVLRKGQMQEWVGTLSLLDKLVAWAIAGRELAWLGYNGISGIRDFRFRDRNL